MSMVVYIIPEEEFVEYHLTDFERELIIRAFTVINREKKRLGLIK